MKADDLKQSEIELISAYLDGELPGEQARDVARRIQEDPAWAATAGEFEQLDGLLDTWQTPRLQRDLTAGIIAATHRKPGLPTWLQWVPPLAAAASIAIAAWLFHTAIPTPSGNLAGFNSLDGQVTEVVKAISPEDRFVVENLDLFQDYDVVALAGADREAPVGNADRRVSVDRQLRLKRKLLLGEESLLAALRVNRDRWNQSTPLQRQQLRDRAYAFRRFDPATQQELLAAWEKFLATDSARQAEYRRQAAELKALLNKLPADPKRRLLEMSPTDRAKELQRIKAEMAEQK